MELKQRKRINNLPKFDGGTDLAGSIKGIGGDITGLNTYKQQLTSVPTKIEVNGMRAPGKLSLGSGGTSGLSAGTVSQAVNGTLGVISGFNQQQAAVKGQSELFGMSGQRTDQAFGVNYQAQNDIDKSQAMADISASNTSNTLAMTGSGAAAGAAIGSVVPGVGTLIGGAAGAIIGGIAGLFGGRKARERQRKRIQNAQQNANLINQVNRSSAASEGLQQQYYMDNGTTYDDLLYANRGKDLKRPRYDKGK